MRLVVDAGRPIVHVAAEIGVGEQLLGGWVAAAKARSAADNPEVLDDDEREESNGYARRTPNCVWTEHFLIKAAAFFVSEQNR